MTATPQPEKMTVEEYLDWEASQPIRHEYINGAVFAMTGGTIPHNDIALNLYRVLYAAIRAQGCRINVADVRVQVTSTVYFYPDLVITCDPRDQNATKQYQYPRLIAEVLSPGTEADDRGRKFTHYRTLSTLQEYVLLDSEQVSVECYRRGEGRLWLYSPYVTGDEILFESIGFSVTTDQLYENVQLDTE